MLESTMALLATTRCKEVAVTTRDSIQARGGLQNCLDLDKVAELQLVECLADHRDRFRDQLVRHQQRPLIELQPSDSGATMDRHGLSQTTALQLRRLTVGGALPAAFPSP